MVDPPHTINHTRYGEWHSEKELKELGISNNIARLIYGHSPNPLIWQKRYSGASPPIIDYHTPNFDSLEQLEEAAEYLHDLANDFTGSMQEFKEEVTSYLQEIEEHESED